MSEEQAEYLKILNGLLGAQKSIFKEYGPKVIHPSNSSTYKDNKAIFDEADRSIKYLEKK